MIRKRKLYWDNINFEYPARSSGVNYFVGTIDPFELGVAEPQDVWIFDLPKPSQIITIDQSNSNNLQTLINGAIPNTRFYFLAGTYRIGNIQIAGKPVQFVGELDAQGDKLVTFLGSEDISGNTWVADGDKYKTNVSPLINQIPSNSELGQGRYYKTLAFQLWVNGIPRNSVPTLLDMLEPNDCYYNSATGEVYLFDIPVGEIEWGIYCHFIAHSNANDSSAKSTASNGLIIAHYDTKYYAGNRNGAVNMLRRNAYLTGDLPILYCCAYNLKVENCRGDAVYMPHLSECRNIESLRNGRGAVFGNIINPTLYPNWDINTAKYGVYRGCKVHHNDWGNEGGDTIKYINGYFFKVLDGLYYDMGVVEEQVGTNRSAYSLWLDDCSYGIVNNTKMWGSESGHAYVEIAQQIYLEHNYFFAARGGFHIFNSTSSQCYYRNNYHELGNESWLIRIGTGDRLNTDNYPPYVLRETEDVEFVDNIAKSKFGLTTLAMLSDSRSVQFTTPRWKDLADRNIIIDRNQYDFDPRYFMGYDVMSYTVGLANIQALTDSANNLVGWEADTVLI